MWFFFFHDMFFFFFYITGSCRSQHHVTVYTATAAPEESEEESGPVCGGRRLSPIAVEDETRVSAVTSPPLPVAFRLPFPPSAPAILSPRVQRTAEFKKPIRLLCSFHHKYPYVLLYTHTDTHIQYYTSDACNTRIVMRVQYTSATMQYCSRRYT